VKISAGTFKSHKISQDVATTIVATTQSHVVSWGALNVGIVKTETYDDNGVLHSSMELIEIK
jgi:hypothetical protein